MHDDWSIFPLLATLKIRLQEERHEQHEPVHRFLRQVFRMEWTELVTHQRRNHSYHVVPHVQI